MKRAANFAIGERIHVGQAFRMGGSFVPDEWTGTWYVVGRVGEVDLKIAHHPQDDWRGIVHVSRIVGSGWYPSLPTPA